MSAKAPACRARARVRTSQRRADRRYYREAENKLYKGAEGETDICFEYDCWIGVRGGDAATLFCNNDTLLKVTCASVEALPAGVSL